MVYYRTSNREFQNFDLEKNPHQKWPSVTIYELILKNSGYEHDVLMPSRGVAATMFKINS